MEGRFPHEQRDLGGLNLEEDAEGVLDRAVGVGQGIEEEKHAVTCREHREALHPHGDAAGEEAAGWRTTIVLAGTKPFRTSSTSNE